MYERFTDRARKVMHLAQQEARKLNHDYVGTEHLLLGLLAEEGGVVATVWPHLEVPRATLEAAVQNFLTKGSDPVPAEAKPALTVFAKKAVEQALEESRRQHAGYVGTEHLLLGLTADSSTVAGFVLGTHGITQAKVRAIVTELTGLHFGQPAGKIDEKPVEVWTPWFVSSIEQDFDNTQQRDRSGSIDDPRPLVSFLYELMRDHVTPGVLEQLVRRSPRATTTKFCNGWLAMYAQDLAERLLSPSPVPEPKPEIKDPPPPFNLVPVIMTKEMAHDLKPGDKVTDGLSAYWPTRVGEVVQREAYAVDVQWPKATKPMRYDVDEVAAYQILRLLRPSQASDHAGNS